MGGLLRRDIGRRVRERSGLPLVLPHVSGRRDEVGTHVGWHAAVNEDDRPHDGYGHVAMSVGSEEAVDALTARLVSDGYRCVSGPRTTGDGYYESCVLDAEGNRVEITV